MCVNEFYVGNPTLAYFIRFILDQAVCMIIVFILYLKYYTSRVLACFILFFIIMPCSGGLETAFEVLHTVQLFCYGNS